MKHSFAPLAPDAVLFLSQATGVDFTRTNFKNQRWLCITGRDGDRLAGVAVFEFKTHFDAYFSCAIADPRCLTRRLLQAMFTGVFSQAVRITAEIDPANGHALKQMERLGFLNEGYKRLAIEGLRDALLFGMTEDTCRFLCARQRARQGLLRRNLGTDHGQHTEAA